MPPFSQADVQADVIKLALDRLVRVREAFQLALGVAVYLVALL